MNPVSFTVLSFKFLMEINETVESVIFYVCFVPDTQIRGVRDLPFHLFSPANTLCSRYAPYSFVALWFSTSNFIPL